MWVSLPGRSVRYRRDIRAPRERPRASRKAGAVHPETDDWGVLGTVRANPNTRALPIVVMSAKFRLFNTRDHGVQGYVAKPFVPLVLLDTLDPVLQGEGSSTDC
jgi:CheY-like chemotaxis protein